MSRQRKRGVPIKVWRVELKKDRRGNDQYVTVPANKHVTTAAVIPQRSARAEVPGQQVINVTRMIVSADLDDVNLWSRIEWDGKEWDIVAPPAYHHGTRHVRHWSIDVRQRA